MKISLNNYTKYIEEYLDGHLNADLQYEFENLLNYDEVRDDVNKYYMVPAITSLDFDKSSSYTFLMNNKVILISVVLSVLLSMGLYFFYLNSQADKYNVIYILADDLGYGDLSCYGQVRFKTPNIDKLAEHGIKFINHYAGSTVCAPSRSALVTGMHTGHTYIRGNRSTLPKHQISLPKEAITIPKLLGNIGYTNGAFGKWGLGNSGSEGDPNLQGFDEFFGYTSHRNAHHYYPYHLWHNGKKIILKGNAGKREGTYSQDTIHKEAMKFLDKNKDDPFFMYYCTILPHAELFAPPRYMEAHKGKYPPEKSYNGTDRGPKFRKGAFGSQEECHAAFAAMINLLDDQVGEIVDKVNELGIADKTLIMFASDNGPHKAGGGDPEYFNGSGGLRGIKRDLFEGGIRAPFIAKLPGKVEPGVSDHICANWDLMPTLCDLVGINPPKNIDGISFLPTLFGGDQKEHDHLYWEFHEQKGKQAVRMGKWKGVKLNMNNRPNKNIKLFDLSVDPAEQNNIADNHPDIVKEIKNIMKVEHRESAEFQFPFEEL